MIRRLIAASLIFSGVGLVNAGIVGWWFDREVTEPERIREMAATLLQSQEVREELAPLVLGEAAASLDLDTADLHTVTETVEASLLDAELVAPYADTVEALYRQVFEGAEGGVQLDTSGVEATVVESLAEIDPDLAAAVGSVSLPDVISFQLDDLPDMAQLESWLGLGWRIALVGGGALLAFGVLVHPRATVALRRIGIMFVVFAGLQILAVWVITDLAAPNVPIEGFDALIEAVSGVLLESLRAQAILQAVAAGTLAATAHLGIWLPRMTAPLRAVTATMGG